MLTDPYTFLTLQLTPSHPLCWLIPTHFSPHSSHQLTLCADWSLHISHLTAHTNSPSVLTDPYTSHLAAHTISPSVPTDPYISHHAAHTSSPPVPTDPYISHLAAHINSPSVLTDP